MKTENINCNIEYEIKLSKNTYWIPIASLGKPKLTEQEIVQLIGMSPEYKRKMISTLYDAVQLFQLSNFTEIEDNKIVKYNSLSWEFHKPGYYSVLTNAGCCASDTSWLLYLLEGKYDQVGVIAFIRPSGNGHSLNYIRHNSWFYFIDLLAHVKKYRPFCAPETGKLSDFARSRYNTGIFIKTKSINDFVSYYSRFLTINKTENLFYSFGNTNACIPIATKNENNILHCFFPEQHNITFYNMCCERIKYSFAKAPDEPEWN